MVVWFREHQRAMPWRDDPQPYRVWISEVMLQQTRVEAVIPYFNRFLVRFPDVESLAAAAPADVLKLWEGLGYYSRARNLHKAAQLVVQQYGGRLPDNYDELLTLPGLGPYAAAAVASIAFGEAVPVVDGNVLRVMTRFWGIADDIRKAPVKKDIAARLTKPIADSGDPSSFNQGMMELGAMICKPKSPKCLPCPLRDDCVALAQGRVEELPVKGKPGAVPHHDLTVAIVEKNGKYLLQQRPADGMLGGMWEWPGGRCKPSDLIELVKQETGIGIQLGQELGRVSHGYSHFTITIQVFIGVYEGGRLKGGDGLRPQWCGRKTITALPMGKAAIQIAEMVDLRQSTQG